MTHFEQIKNMTIEELTEFLCRISRCEYCEAKKECFATHTGFIDWLKKEAESE